MLQNAEMVCEMVCESCHIGKPIGTRAGGATDGGLGCCRCRGVLLE